MSSWFAGKSVAVTGGAGFIGSYLVELLLADGADVVAVDDLSRGNVNNLASVRNDVELLELDMRVPECARKACRGRDVVLNLASPVAGVQYSATHHGAMLTGATTIAATVLEAARLEGVGRYLYCSSSCVYPDDCAVPTPETDSERGSPESLNEGYGWGKRFGELQAVYYAREYDIEVAIARPFNSYGARQHIDADIDRAQLLPALIGRILRGDDPLLVWGSGNQTRSLTHGRDTALGLKLVCERHAVADPVNVGHDVETSVRELVELLLNVTGRAPKVVYDTTRPEGSPRKAADVTKLRRVTGFVPQTDLRAGLAEMVDYCARVYDAGVGTSRSALSPTSSSIAAARCS